MVADIKRTGGKGARRGRRLSKGGERVRNFFIEKKSRGRKWRKNPYVREEEKKKEIFHVWKSMRRKGVKWRPLGGEGCGAAGGGEGKEAKILPNKKFQGKRPSWKERCASNLERRGFQPKRGGEGKRRGLREGKSTSRGGIGFPGGKEGEAGIF